MKESTKLLLLFAMLIALGYACWLAFELTHYTTTAPCDALLDQIEEWRANPGIGSEADKIRSEYQRLYWECARSQQP